MIEKPRQTPRPIFLVILVIIIASAGATVFLFLSGLNNSGNQYCRLDSSGKLLDTCVPLFRIVNGTNDTIQFDNSSLLGGPAPPADECNHYAEIALEQYGGLPEDAVLIGIENGTIGLKYNPTTKESTPPVVETRRLTYLQKPYGFSIVKKGGKMQVDIGAGGVIPELEKHWYSLEETGLIKIISQSEAVQRLQEGQCHDLPDLALNLSIHNMTLGYYPPVNKIVPQYLEPVWIIDAIDETRGRSMQLYVPAEANQSGGYKTPELPVSRYKNFTLIRNDTIRQKNIYPAGIWLGPTGPVDRENASNTIKMFTEKPDLNLTYKGRFFESGSGGCGGSSYFWDYYEFSTPDCNFRVDSYTGTMLLASLNTTCSNAKIGAFNMSKATVPLPSMISKVTNFTRERYYHFDQRRMNLDVSSYSWYSNDFFDFRGDRAVQSDYEIWLNFRPDDGLLTNYVVRDDVVEYACMDGGKPIKIRKE